MICELAHPGLLLILCGLLLPVLRIQIGRWIALGLSALALILILSLDPGDSCKIHYMGMVLSPLRVDKISQIFLIIFGLTLLVGTLFCFIQARKSELAGAFIYAGAAISVVLAADLISLFIFWELMALASTVIIWSGATPQSQHAGMRYLLIHLLGGVILLVGIIAYAVDQQSIQFNALGLDRYYNYLILIGFLLNAAAPPFSAWLADAYPESSFSGMVYLSAFTTKTAVYVLLRGFPGTEWLIWLGLFMIFYGIIYALLENDMRRILAYSIVNQVGFMLCGIGIGSELALNGTIAHAFTHIVYKALLLMSAGSVLYMTGRRKCTELGGLVQSMPLTTACGIIGALSISSFPLTSGFISKSMIVQAVADQHLLLIWLLLQAASAGVFLHAGIKFPWFVFFQRDRGLRSSDPPWNMQLAMLLFASLCIILGWIPDYLYAYLPFTVAYVPYTASHVLTQLQLLLFSGLAFFILLPWMRRTMTISLDTDWFYRRPLPGMVHFCNQQLAALLQHCKRQQQAIHARLRHSYAGLTGRIRPSPYRLLLIIATLGGVLIYYF